MELIIGATIAAALMPRVIVAGIVVGLRRLIGGRWWR